MDQVDFANKKKKKKGQFVLVADAPIPPLSAAGESTASASVLNEVPQMDFTNKKKKKKAAKIDVEMPADDVTTTSTVDVNANATPTSKNIDGVSESVTQSKDENTEAAPSGEQLNFAHKKKKKRQGNPDDAKTANSQQQQQQQEKSPKHTDTALDDSGVTSSPPASFTRYEYDWLLKRIYDQIAQNNPDRSANEKKRLTLVPPILARVGTKRTLFTNFAANCELIKREPNHVREFITSEFGTSASVDQNNALLIRGRYVAKNIESVLRSYCRNYVLCKTCNSPDTELSKDARLLFLTCNVCGSKCTVKSVTAGFQAQVTKRGNMRGKAH